MFARWRALVGRSLSKPFSRYLRWLRQTLVNNLLAFNCGRQKHNGPTVYSMKEVYVP